MQKFNKIPFGKTMKKYEKNNKIPFGLKTMRKQEKIKNKDQHLYF